MFASAGEEGALEDCDECRVINTGCLAGLLVETSDGIMRGGPCGCSSDRWIPVEVPGWMYLLLLSIYGKSDVRLSVTLVQGEGARSNCGASICH